MPSSVNRTSLALTKISTIMKSTANVESLSKESVWFMAKATEMFISNLVKETCAASANKKKLHYKYLAEIVNGTRRYCFLVDIIPKKITFAEYKRIKAGKEGDSNEKLDSRSSEDDVNDDDEDDNENGEDDEEGSSSENSRQSD